MVFIMCVRAVYHVYRNSIYSCCCCSLSELEMTRDDLLIQLHQSSEAFVDKNTVEFA